MVIVISFAIILFIIRLVRTRQLRAKYSVLWFSLGLALAVLAIFPDLLVDLSDALNIDYRPRPFMLAALGFLLVIVLHFIVGAQPARGPHPGARRGATRSSSSSSSTSRSPRRPRADERARSGLGPGGDDEPSAAKGRPTAPSRRSNHTTSLAATPSARWANVAPVSSFTWETNVRTSRRLVAPVAKQVGERQPREAV
jgi:hypothetical protein